MNLLFSLKLELGQVSQGEKSRRDVVASLELAGSKEVVVHVIVIAKEVAV